MTWFRLLVTPHMAVVQLPTIQYIQLLVLPDRGSDWPQAKFPIIPGPEDKASSSEPAVLIGRNLPVLKTRALSPGPASSGQSGLPVSLCMRAGRTASHRPSNFLPERVKFLNPVVELSSLSPISILHGPTLETSTLQTEENGKPYISI